MLTIAPPNASAVLGAAHTSNGPAAGREPGSGASFARVLSQRQDHSEAQRQRAAPPEARERPTPPAHADRPQAQHPVHPVHPVHPAHPPHPPHPAHPEHPAQHSAPAASQAGEAGRADANDAADAEGEAAPGGVDTPPAGRTALRSRWGPGAQVVPRASPARSIDPRSGVDPAEPARDEAASDTRDHGLPQIWTPPALPDTARAEACAAAPVSAPANSPPVDLALDAASPVGSAGEPDSGAARVSHPPPAGGAGIGGTAPAEPQPAEVGGNGRSAGLEPGVLTAPGLAWSSPSALASLPAASVVELAPALASPDFTRTLAVQVSILAQGGVQHARLELNPSEMGPVSVKIVIEGQQAKVEFGADLAATRSAIEAGLPELAGALREAGLTLTGGGVSQHARDPDRGQPGPADAERAGAPGSPQNRAGRDDRDAAPVPMQRRVRAGGVDLYA